MKKEFFKTKSPSKFEFAAKEQRVTSGFIRKSSMKETSIKAELAI
jgi:hypothetical protein